MSARAPLGDKLGPATCGSLAPLLTCKAPLGDKKSRHFSNASPYTRTRAHARMSRLYPKSGGTFWARRGLAGHSPADDLHCPVPALSPGGPLECMAASHPNGRFTAQNGVTPMARNSRVGVVGPHNYKRHPDQAPLAPALKEVLEEGDPELFQTIATAVMRARAAGQDVTDPTVITFIVASCRADLDERDAS